MVKMGAITNAAENLFRKVPWETLKVGLGTGCILIMGFLLGRAQILGEMSPFALPYFAVILRLRQGLGWGALAAVTLGSIAAHGIWHVWPQTLIMLLLYRGLVAVLSKGKQWEWKITPLLVFLVNAVVRISATMLVGDGTQYSLLIGVAESFLATVLTYIFIQSLPVLTFQRGVKVLRNEEIICLVIFMASMLTGLQNLTVFGISLEHIFSRYLILVFALVGGAGIGAGVGIVTGMILTMSSISAVYQVGLLGFSGLLGGLLKESRKLGVGFGFLLATGILTVYISDWAQLFQAAKESVGAVVLLLLTPRIILDQISTYVPGTVQNRLSQQEYARRIRDLMANRIREVSNVFEELSRTFSHISASQVKSQEETLMKTVEVVCNQVCSSCVKKTQCWERDFYPTYRGMLDTFALIEAQGQIQSKDIAPELRNRCIRTEQLTPALHRAMEQTQRDLQWQHRLRESRDLVAGQLSGLSNIMHSLSIEITKENHLSADHEEHILAAIEHLGLTIEGIEIICLDEGKVEIEVTTLKCGDHMECERMIAPLLSEILGENITVGRKRCGHDEGFCIITLCSAKVFEVSVGFASAAKDGKVMSGDSFTMLDVGNGKYALAVSDGMGNGERAMQESSAAIRLLGMLLKAGFDEQIAIKTVNSVLLLRSQEEMFTTLDLALIDLFTARTEFLKIGSAPSFIKRGFTVKAIRGENVPIGILQDIDIQTVEFDLLEGDLLVLMSDGIYEAPRHVTDREQWLLSQIQGFESQDPQQIADMLVELAVRLNGGRITDDMTVVVARIDKHQPEWASIKIPGMQKIHTRKTDTVGVVS